MTEIITTEKATTLPYMFLRNIPGAIGVFKRRKHLVSIIGEFSEGAIAKQNTQSRHAERYCGFTTLLCSWNISLFVKFMECGPSNGTDLVEEGVVFVLFFSILDYPIPEVAGGTIEQGSVQQVSFITNFIQEF